MLPALLLSSLWLSDSHLPQAPRQDLGGPRGIEGLQQQGSLAADRITQSPRVTGT